MGKKYSLEQMVERYPGTTKGMWAMRRYHALPPVWQKIGKTVFYDEEILDDFDKATTRNSTSGVA